MNQAISPPHQPKVAGLTLIEVIAAVAIVALLAGSLAPMFGERISTAQIDAARADVETIGQAIGTFMVTTGEWPNRNVGGGPKLWALATGTSLSGNPFRGSHSFWSWATSSRGDLLQNHFVANQPKADPSSRYPTSGRLAWRGPYLDASPLDPWGRPYLINVRSVSSDDPIAHRRLWVLSAGPDGAIQTSAQAGHGDTAAGDDIAFLARMR